jgi:hypothetical protein
MDSYHLKINSEPITIMDQFMNYSNFNQISAKPFIFLFSSLLLSLSPLQIDQVNQTMTSHLHCSNITPAPLSHLLGRSWRKPRQSMQDLHSTLYTPSPPPLAPNQQPVELQ